mmetsp:Transcript_13411/g.27276  ORF Transcript_13411/g.27276 Transcript_13411/m.27276 type:complete len:350 (+) Transcript_13411:2428-3477(+)
MEHVPEIEAGTVRDKVWDLHSIRRSIRFSSIDTPRLNHEADARLRVITNDETRSLSRGISRHDSLGSLVMMTDMLGKDGRESCSLTSSKLSMTPRMADITSTRSAHVPAVLYCEYGADCNKDIVGGPDNAVRLQLRQLVRIVASLDGRSTVTQNEIALFFRWWTPLPSFFSCYFTALENVVFASIEAFGSLDGPLLPENRSLFKSKVESVIDSISSSQDTPITEDRGRFIDLLVRATNKLTFVLLGYMNELERTLPKALSFLIKPPALAVIRKEMGKIFTLHPMASSITILLGKWLVDYSPSEGAKVYADWKASHLSKTAVARTVVWEKADRGRDELFLQLIQQTSSGA